MNGGIDWFKNKNMEKENKFIRIPIKFLDDEIMVECFVNNCLRGYYIINLEMESTILNKHCFMYLLKNKNETEVFIKSLYCRGVKLENTYLKFRKMSEYQYGQVLIYGILGKTFFNDYDLVDIDRKRGILLFRENKLISNFF